MIFVRSLVRSLLMSGMVITLNACFKADTPPTPMPLASTEAASRSAISIHTPIKTYFMPLGSPPPFTKEQPLNIAVVLPLSGYYARLGQAVQEGMLNAYYAQAEHDSVNLTFYDSNAQSIKDIYNTIQAKGEKLILGPLIKEETAALLNKANEFPGIISLNYTDIRSPETHLEFGLSSEDEIRQLALFAWQQGKRSALILSSASEKDEETAEAFTDFWETLGGHVVDQYTYKNTDQFSKTMANFLKASPRKQKGKDKQPPYFRQDADMVLLIATPKIARQINSFIKFYADDSLSVFASSKAYAGFVQVNDDKDLNGVYFCDMPAVFQSHRPSQENRLYFLGEDAYSLAVAVTQLSPPATFPFFGKTGSLIIDPQTHHIQRVLTCAQFKEGVATLINTESKRTGD